MEPLNVRDSSPIRRVTQTPNTDNYEDEDDNLPDSDGDEEEEGLSGVRLTYPSSSEEEEENDDYFHQWVVDDDIYADDEGILDQKSEGDQSSLPHGEDDQFQGDIVDLLRSSQMEGILRDWTNSHPANQIVSDDISVLGLDNDSSSEESSPSVPHQHHNDGASSFKLHGLSSRVRAQLKWCHDEDHRSSRIPFKEKASITRSTFVFMELLMILINAQAPLELYDTIVKWAERASAFTDGFNPTHVPAYTRETMLNHLRRIIGRKTNKRRFETMVIAKETHNHSSFVLPTVAEIVLKRGSSAREHTTSVSAVPTSAAPSAVMQSPPIDAYQRGYVSKRDTISVLRFRFVEQLQRLLDTHSLFGQKDNLVLNSECPWLPYAPGADEPTDDVLSGEWYSRTVKSLGLDRLKTKADWVAADKPFLLPLILYVDKTGTDMMCRYSLEPFIFTVAILSRELRNLSMSWTHFGFVPEMNDVSSAQNTRYKTGELGKGRSCRIYHKSLEVLLEDLTSIHSRIGPDGNPLPIPLRVTIGNEVQVVNCYIPVAYVIGDNKSNDFLCGKIGGPDPNKPCITRGCLCPSAKADCTDQSKKCTFLKKRQV